MGGESDSGTPRGVRRLELAALALIFLGGAALRIQDLQSPFGHGFRGTNAALYYGQFEKHYLEHGLAGTRYGLVLQSWPGREDGMFRDLAHPTLPSYLFHGAVLLSDDVELGLRIVPFLASTLAILGIWGVARALMSRAAALATALLAATSPMWAYFGVMVVAECLLLLWGSLVLLAVIRFLQGRVGLWRVLALFFVGCLFDWNFYFFAPGAWVTALLWPERPARWRRLGWMFPVGCVAFAIYFAHGAWAAGGTEALLDKLRQAGDTASGAVGWSEWSARHQEYVSAWYGLPLLGLAAFGLGLGLLTIRDAARRRRLAAAAFFLVAGGISVLLFRRHSYDHAFWTMGMAGGVYLLAGSTLDAGSSRFASLLRAGLAGLILFIALRGVTTTLEAQEAERTTVYRDRVAVVNDLAGPGDVVITSEPWRQEVFYVRAHAFPFIRERLRVEHDLIGRFGLEQRIVFLFPQHDIDGDPGVRDLVAWITPYCKPPEVVDRFVVYVFEP